MRGRVDFRVSILVFAVLLLASEVVLRAFKGPLWARGACRELVSPQLLQDRLAALRIQRGKRLLLLGDSVFYGSALREKGLPDWQHDTLPSSFRQDARWSGWSILDFSGDGLNPADMDALLHASEDLHPDAVVLELNYRMLAEKAGQGPDIMAHPWLTPYLNPALEARVMAGRPSRNFDERLRDGMVEFLRNGSHLFRYAELGGDLLLNPSARDLAGRMVAGVFPPQDNSDQNEVLLDFKLRPYYGAPAAAADHASLAALRDMDLFFSSHGMPVLVFLTPQNRERVRDFLDPGAFRSNRDILSRCFPGHGRLAYKDWADQRPAGQFLDHCHLDGQGNLGLERKITETMVASCQLLL